MSTEIDAAAIIRSHADALAEAGRLREIVQEIAACGYFDYDPEYKRTRYVDVQIDRTTMSEMAECLTLTPTTAAWLEARDRRMKLIGAAEELEVLAHEWSKRGRERRFLAQELTERAAQLRLEADSNA